MISNEKKFNLYWEHDLFSNQIKFYLYSRDENGRRYICKPVDLVFELKNEAERVSDPSFILSDQAGLDFINGVANSLAEQDIKTNKDARLEGTMEAMKLHLEDMRKLVFK